MDSIDIIAKKAATTATKPSDKNEDLEKNPKRSANSVNIHATASYLKMVSSSQDNLPKSLQGSLNQLKSSLSSYMNTEDFDSVEVDTSKENTSTFNNLSYKVLQEDSNLQDKVAQGLSSPQKFVRSRDAKDTLKQNFDNLPPTLKEGSRAGQDLSKFVLECLVSLADSSYIGAGLEKDLATRHININDKKLSGHEQVATSQVLAKSLAFIQSNQKDVIEKLPKNEVIQEKPGTTTPQIMTRYLRKALDEFPEDSTYLDIFKQNKAHNKTDPHEDKVSEEISKRIHNLISKAAETARRGNLISTEDNSEYRKDAKSLASTATSTQLQAKNQNTVDIDDNNRELSLSELSARASRLQQQFRQGREKLAQEGKLPDPAKMPENFPPSLNKKDVNSNKESLLGQGPGTIIQRNTKGMGLSDNIHGPSTLKAQINAAREQYAQNNKSTIDFSNTLNKTNIKYSYNATINNDFGKLSSVPGQTISVHETKDVEQAQKQDAPRSHVTDTQKLVEEITKKIKEEIHSDIQKTIEQKTSNLSELLGDIKATALDIKNKAFSQESSQNKIDSSFTKQIEREALASNKVDSKPVVSDDALVDDGVEVKPNTDAKPQTKPAPETDADAQVETKPTTNNKVDSKPVVSDDALVDDGVEVKPNADVKPQTKPAPETDADTQVETKPTTNNKVEGKPVVSDDTLVDDSV